MAGSIPPWVSRVKPIVDGEPVKASVANRLPSQIQQRTENLKARLDLAELGELLVLRDVPLSSNTETGYAVYWNSTSKQYEPALSKITFDGSVSGYTIAESCYAVGVVIDKSVATTGTIALFGVLKDFDWTHAIGTTGSNPEDAGAYYVSSSNPGRLTKQKPAVGVYVLYLRGDGAAHLNPSPREMLEQHTHFAYDLYAEPAGYVACTESGYKYEFLSTDPGLPGWLPASHFDNAPVGAKFGYNLAAHPELDRVWPPIPTDLVYLEENGIGVNPSKYVADANGLWWMDDCYGRAPWPTSYGCSDSLSSGILEGSSCYPATTLEEEGYYRVDPSTKNLRVYFVKMTYKTSASVVTSLTPAEGSPIILRDCDGNNAIRGDLVIDFDLNGSITEGDRSYNAFKGVTGFSFSRGPIVSGIKALDDTIEISIPDATKGQLDEHGFYRGELQIAALSDNARRREGTLDLVALNGVIEDTIVDGGDDTRGIYMLTFPQGSNTSLCGKISLPVSGLPANPKLKLYFWLMARTSGSALPVLNLAINRLTKPTGCTSESLSPSFTTLPGDGAHIDASGCGTLSSGSYVEVESAEISVENGQDIYFQVKRLGSTDGYSAGVSAIKIGYVITAG